MSRRLQNDRLRACGLNVWLMILIIMLGIVLKMNSHAIAENFDSPSTNIFIKSRFMLWDDGEKMLDNNFTICILLINETSNNTGYIEINAGNTYINETMQFYKEYYINWSGSDIIPILTVKTDNQTVFTATNIAVISGMTGDRIRQAKEPFTINLNPLEWSRKEWNIFYAIVSACLLSVIMGWRIVKRYRAYRGVVVIE